MPRRQNARSNGSANGHDPEFDNAAPVKTKALRPLTERQGQLIETIDRCTLSFALGPAGTGKTYIAVAKALDALRRRDTEKVILTRPAQEAGESLGFLPGELDEKYAPYLRPFWDIMYQRLGSGGVDCAVRRGSIEPLPLAFMRGMTFNDCWVLLDEAQNTTPDQMRMFLTRIGRNCKVIISGDHTPHQRDITGASGLLDGFNHVRHLPEVGAVLFDSGDVVRSGLAQEIVQAYETGPVDDGVARFLGNST